MFYSDKHTIQTEEYVFLRDVNRCLSSASHPPNCNIKAFEVMFKTYYRALCFQAEGIVGEKEAAEEIVSDFFLKLWEDREIIQITVSLQAYLHKGVYNSCLKYLEHIKVLRKYHEHARYVTENRDLFDTYDDDNPLSMLISQETTAEIERAIDALPAQCKEVFQLTRMDGLSYQEAADNLGISVNTVRTQITRAMSKLREALGQYQAR